MIDAFRARADELGSTRPTGRFRTHTSLDDGPAHERRVVAQAVARAKAGDHEAIRFLYMRYADNVYGYVRSIVRDHHEAEDVTQHVFAKLMTALPKYEAREVPFAAWILRVARNLALDHLRQRRAIPCEEVRELEPSRDDRGESQQTSLALREAQQPGGERDSAAVVLDDHRHQLREHLLRDVFGLVVVADDAADVAVDVVGVAHVQEAQRLLVAGPGACHRLRDDAALSRRAVVEGRVAAEAARRAAVLQLVGAGAERVDHS